MLSNTGVEFPGAINRNLNWKTPDEGRQWAVKRARSSFSGGRRKSSVTKSSKGSEFAMDKLPSRTGEMPDSDSEKVGISILGRHFSDSLEIVPIKKRKFLFARSPSSPQQLSYSDDSDNLLGGNPSSFTDPLILDKDHDRKFVANKITSLNHLVEEANDVADFSGISILAAAACNSEMVSESTHSHNLDLNGNSCKEIHLEHTKNDKSHSSREDREQQLQSFDDLRENNVNVNNSTSAADEVKIYEPQNMTSSMVSLPAVSDKIGPLSVSRLHWDLNTDMDAWNSNSDQIVISESVTTDLAGENGKVNEDLVAFDSCECKAENGECRNSPAVENLVSVVGITGYSSTIISNESSEKPDNCNGLSVSNHQKGCSIPHGHIMVEEEHDKDATVVHLTNPAEETKIMRNQRNTTCSTEVATDVLRSSRVGSLAIECIDTEKDKMSSDLEVKSRDGSLATQSNDIEKDKMSSGLEVKSEITAFSENISCEFNSDTFKSHSYFVQSLSKPIYIESGSSIAPNAEQSSADQCLNNFEEQPRHISDLQRGHWSISLSEKGDNVTFVDNANLDGECQTSGEAIRPVGLDMSSEPHADKSLQLNCHQHDSPGPSKPDHQNCKVKCSAKCESIIEDFKSEVDSPSDSNPPVYVSSVTATLRTDTNLVCAVGTPEAGQSYMDISANFNGDHASDVSQVGAVQISGLEKANLLGDDDSQFEDGEVRESILHNWGEDSIDEVESEHVDYGSDNGLNDICEMGSDVPASVPLSDVSITINERNLSDTDKTDDGKNRQVAISQPSSRCSSKSDGLGSVGGTRTICEVALKEADDSTLNRSRKKSKIIDFHNEGDNTREPSANVRLRSSGWDLLPESHRLSGNNPLEIGFGKQDSTASSLGAFSNGESLGRSGSAFRGGLSSRVERLKSLDESHRNDNIYEKLSRYNDSDSVEAKAERNNTGPQNSTGWGGSSRHTHGRGRDEHWFEPNCRGPRNHNSPGYYDPHSYTRPSRNAAAAAVAKVESNGFVVAPDGTLVKVASVGSAGLLPKKSPIMALQSSHPSVTRWELQDERDRVYRGHRPRNPRETSDRHFGVGGQAGKYAHDIDDDQYDNKPLPHDRMESSLGGHRLPTRDRSTSPYHRGTRSSVSRMERRSPNRRASFEERLNVYGSGSTTVASPSRTSEWVDDRKDSPNHHREQGYRRPSRRSPTIKVFTGHRFDSLDSQGRPKPDDYYHHNQGPLQSSRKGELVSFGRGYKYDARSESDKRGHGGRYEFLRSMRQCDDVNEKRLISKDGGTVQYRNPGGCKSRRFQQRRREPEEFG